MNLRSEEAAEILRAARALGADPAIALHDGGDASIKTRVQDASGRYFDVLLIKRSGEALATIAPDGFVAVRRDRLLEWLEADNLDGKGLAAAVRQAMLDPDPRPASVDAILHAYVPARVVLHSHPDAIAALTATETDVRSVFDARTLVLPYVAPGFALAKLVKSLDLDGKDAIVLSRHGLITFAADADEALRRHREVIKQAQQAIDVRSGELAGDAVERGGAPKEIAELRRAVCKAAGRPFFLRQSSSSRALAHARRADLSARNSPLLVTPEHIFRTKAFPLIGRDVERYADDYREYASRNRPLEGSADLFETDPAPRVIFDSELGLLTAGATVSSLRASADIALHAMDVVDAAERAGGYSPLDEALSAEVGRLCFARSEPGEGPLAGEVAVVTGAASGIGRAVAAALLQRGAAVMGVDLSSSTPEAFSDTAWAATVGDASDPSVLEKTFATATRDFGGVDILVLAAGIFPRSAPIALLEDAAWERALRVNASAVFRALRAAHPFLALSQRGGRVVLVSTKNVLAPGPGAGAYSASKTAAAQIARVAALEWASEGIRVNQVEPDAVFDTAIWTPELIAARARQYGMTVEQYRTRNLMKVEITSAMVADAVMTFCDGLPATTGGHLNIDGGNDRVI